MTTNLLLYGFLVVGALPILVPYLWLVTVAFSGRTGASTFVLWRTLAVLLPALFLWSLLRLTLEPGRLPEPRRDRIGSRRWRSSRSSPGPISISTTGGSCGIRTSPTR